MITYRKGDLMQVKSGILAHGCNMHGVMGSGVAKLVKEMYPKAFERYRKDLTGGFPLGSVSVWSPQETGTVEFLVASCLTQEDMGYDGKRYVSYDAIDSCFNILNIISIKAGLPIHIPRIGAGLGGGSWDVIAEIIRDRCEEVSVTVWDLPS